MTSQEIWKPARGYDGYEVSNHGYVRDAVTGKLIPFHKVKGLIIVNIHNNHKWAGVSVSKLVLEAFSEFEGWKFRRGII